MTHGVSQDRSPRSACGWPTPASLLLPVSNLANLLALPHLDLTVGGFSAAMAPVLAVVLLVEYVGLRVLSRKDLRNSDP